MPYPEVNRIAHSIAPGASTIAARSGKEVRADFFGV